MQPVSRNKGVSKGQPPSSSGHGGNGGKPNGFSKKVYLADQTEESQAEPEQESAEGSGGDREPEHAAVDDNGVEDDGDPDQEEAADLAEVAEVLSVTAKKLSAEILPEGPRRMLPLSNGKPTAQLAGKRVIGEVTPSARCRGKVLPRSHRIKHTWCTTLNMAPSRSLTTPPTARCSASTWSSTCGAPPMAT